MTVKSLLRITLPACFLMVSLGCSELDAFTPDVTFERFEVNSIDFESADVDFVFQVDNPNPVSVGLSSFSYGLAFEEIEIISGDNEDGFKLAASGSAPLELPVHIDWADTWELVQATRGLDDVGYGLDGHMGFNLPELGEAKLPYDVDGSFPALRTPKLSLKALRAESVGLTGATLALDIGVDNDHASNLLFENFAYNLTIGGSPLATGIVNSFADAEGGAETTVALPIEVNFLTAGVVLVSAITGGGDLDVGLGANVDVLTPFTNEVVPLKVDLVELLSVSP
jgi:LEA14-like dessication related protein